MKTIETERLIFRLYDKSLHDDFISLFTDEEVMKYVDKGVLSRAATEALWRRLVDEFYPQGINTIWAVVAKGDARFIANASIRPRPEHKNEIEIGYVLAKDEWGKGYASEIAARLIEYGFKDLQLNTVFATVDIENKNSIRVLEKCGMNLVRTEYDEAGKFYVYGVKKLSYQS